MRRWSGLGGVVEAPAGRRARSRSPITTRSGWCGERLVDLVAHGEPRVVDRDGAGADEHHVALAPQPVRVAPGRPAGDPAAGAVGGGAAAVERGGELPGDERAAVLDGERPGPVEGAGLVDEQPALDLDAGGAQRRGAARGDRVGVGLGEDHAAYAGGEQRLGARAGAAGVVARLERHDRGRAAGVVAGRGQRVDLGVRRAGAAVVALGDLGAVGVEQHAADPRVGAERDAGRRRQRRARAASPPARRR